MINTAGLVFTLAGVILLFRYGMPYRVASNEGEIRVTTSVRSDTARLDRRYRCLGTCGLIAIVLGTGLQIFAVWA